MKKTPYHLEIMRKNKGFTLVEVIIVLIIGGIVMAMLINFLTIGLRNAKAQDNINKMEIIQQEMQRFLDQTGRYPCPASITQASDSATFGREAHPTCTDNATIAGVTRAVGRAGRQIKIGAVPVRSINLPDEFLFDAYGSRFVYAVTEMSGVSSSFNRDNGSIDVVDTGNNSLFTPSGSAHFVLLSHGPNRNAGYSSVSGLRPPGSCAAPLSSLEIENCDNDNIFVSSILTSDAQGSAAYDDRVIAEGVTGFGQNVPTGAIVNFDIAACPRGWQNYTGVAPPSGLIACKKI